MGRSTIAPQHHQLLLPLWFKMRTLIVEFGALVKDGIVQLQDACEGVG